MLVPFEDELSHVGLDPKPRSHDDGVQHSRKRGPISHQDDENRDDQCLGEGVANALPVKPLVHEHPLNFAGRRVNLPQRDAC